MKTTKLILNGLMLLVFLLTAKNFAQDDEPIIKKMFNVNKGGKLTVDVNPGEIKISTWSRDEVEVKIDGLDEEGLSKVEITSDKNNVSIVYDESWSSSDAADYKITVPDKYNLDLRTSAGDIKVNGNIEGNVKVATSGGDLAFRNVYGDLRAEASGGNISVRGNVDGNLNVSTMGGDITIGSINGKSARINTMGGEITINDCASGVVAKTYGGDIVVGNTGGNSEFETYGGNISVGKVNGSVSMETYGGNLDLKGANGKVKAKTNGGNVVFRNVNGSIDVKTLAGDISVELNPSVNSESKITTNAGSIELKIPSSAKTTIDARVHIQGWWKNAADNYKIHSDFEPQLLNTDNIKHDIVGTYILNGGGSKIYLKSVNDEITIKKN
jgi:DUF4097 and DUF4098 domain-containing protein YvlB